MTTNTMKKVEAFNQAAKAAAETIRPLYESARADVEAERDTLAASTDMQSKIDTYTQIIVEAVEALDVREETLSTALNQYVAAIASGRQLSATNQRNGAFWIATFNRYSRDWGQPARIKLLAALVKATQGRVDAGVIDFPDSLAKSLESLQDAEQLAELIAPEKTESYRKKLQRDAGKLLKAQRLLDALAQAEPRLFTTDVSDEAAVGIQNNRGGQVSVAGVALAGGTITEVSAAEFDKLRNHPMYIAMTQDGTLRITSAAQLAVAV
ncbi:hypothetical protein [uncultured Alcanivorax sp.]|uniref:hypothetical protein n=1 Tax=uncultured Alcanivorax sp. TaxID=191215 RepID=UPI00262EE6D0|nr:hypothetical protein [uncultured Alcanivorax sp.]